MKLLDSDLLGILLALLTFIVPAVSGVLEKKRKERKSREAELYSQPQPEWPPQQEDAESAEDTQTLEDEVDELFNILMGKETAQEEEILPDSHQQPQTQESWHQETLQCEDPVHHEPAAEEVPVPMYEMVEEKVETQTEQVMVTAKPEPKEENSLKRRIKGNPKEAVVLSEILTPKFKEYN